MVVARSSLSKFFLIILSGLVCNNILSGIKFIVSLPLVSAELGVVDSVLAVSTFELLLLVGSVQLVLVVLATLLGLLLVI